MNHIIPSAPMTAPFAHHGRTGTFIRLSLVNLLLNIITFSLWRFWGKTRVRRALWAGTTAWGDAAEYTGTGRELFLGFLVVVIAVLMPLMIAISALQTALASGQAWAVAAQLAIQVFALFLAFAGLYRARRYQLSRTVWRGIRAGQSGAAWRYGLMALGVGLMTVVTLGWAMPWGEMKLARYRMGNTTFGNHLFECDARAKGLYKRFAVVWLACFVFLAGVGAVFAASRSYLTDPDKALLAILVGYLVVMLWGLLTLGLPLA